MAIDPYASCPCGSGKKFKWCCQPIHGEIEKAFSEHNAGQFEAALKSMEAVVAANEGNPEAWGRQAQLLSLNGKLEEAEKALDKAFSLNPNYAFGYLMRGQFRLNEGEIIGALSLFRKAAYAYAPDAHDPVAYAYELIADIEMRRNHPVAAAAALRKAMHALPGSNELRQAYDTLFGDKSRVPPCGRKDYAFRTTPTPSAEWSSRLQRAATGKFTDALSAFAEWTSTHPDDAVGWFNLGLVQAWLGGNAAAVESLSKSVDLESDEDKAAEAWSLCEVLLCGDGMNEGSDYAEHRAAFPLQSSEQALGLIDRWAQSHRLVGLRADPEQGILTGLLLEPASSLVETADAPAFAKLAAYLLVAGNSLQLWNANEESLDKAIAEVEKALGPTTKSQKMSGPAMFPDVVVDAMIFPTKQTTELDATAKVREAAAGYFEERWIHKPLKSLGGVPPVDAAGHGRLRRKLRGVIQFLKDCAELSGVKLYDFDRLRRKLGLLAASAAGPIDLSAMSAAELAAVDIPSLASDQLAEAFRTAIKLDAKELAGKFARAMVDRPGDGDRLPYFLHLIQLVQAESHWDDALALVDEGEKHDCEHNEGRRRNDYELRRGQFMAKDGDAVAAAEVFTRLVERQPDELKYFEAAAKAMLDVRSPKALTFAEQGLTKARSQNNRDAEEYFLDLTESARKLAKS
jgi:tetratricopeptide (TPR) repeat protein